MKNTPPQKKMNRIHGKERRKLKHIPVVKKNNKKPRPVAKKQVTAKSEPKLFRSDGIEQGHIKLKKDEKVLPTKIHDPKQQRPVPLNDVRNTLIFVNINDTRSDDEVRRAFIEKNEREFAQLKSSKLKPSKKQKKEVEDV